MKKNILIITVCFLVNLLYAQNKSNAKIRLTKEPHNPILVILEDNDSILDTVLTSYANIELIDYKVINRESVIFITKIPRIGILYDHFIKYKEHWIPSIKGIMIQSVSQSYADPKKYIEWKEKYEGIEYKIIELDKISSTEDRVKYTILDLSEEVKEDRKKLNARKKSIDAKSKY